MYEDWGDGNGLIWAKVLRHPCPHNPPTLQLEEKDSATWPVGKSCSKARSSRMWKRTEVIERQP